MHLLSFSPHNDLLILMLHSKTRIALEYASKHEKSDSVSVFWVHASTAERVKKAYHEIAKEAGLKGVEDPKVDQLQMVKRWLEGNDSGSWVMVIDNADDENLSFGEDDNHGPGSSNASTKLARYFPRRSNGSILLTTRNRKLGVKFAGAKLTTVGGLITIPQMSVSESKNLLVEKLEGDDYDDHDLTELVEILEHLPLAIVQAAAFIGENSQSIGEYLQLYRVSDSSKIKLLSQNFEDEERDPDIKNPVAVTWAISFELIRKTNLRAAELLSFMSVLDRQNIPKTLLSSEKKEVELEKALGTLKGFSLITVEQSHQAFNMHRLVYLFTRNWLSMNKELDSWTGKALVLLSKAFPEGTDENREIWMAYLPHAITILGSDRLPANENTARASLLCNVSEALEQKGEYYSAETMAQKSVDLRKNVLGEKSLETLDSLSRLGTMLWRQGKSEKAEEIVRQVLSDYEKILGSNSSQTMEIRNKLGIVLSGQGQFEEAEKVHRRALSDREKILGQEHLATLASISNYANVLYYQGKYDPAEALNRRALRVTETKLGKEHPDILTSVNNLANVLQRQGKYDEFEKLIRRALSARERVIRKKHPDTQ